MRFASDVNTPAPLQKVFNAGSRERQETLMVAATDIVLDFSEVFKYHRNKLRDGKKLHCAP